MSSFRPSNTPAPDAQERDHINGAKLKIDREFVTRVDERTDSQAICAAEPADAPATCQGTRPVCRRR